MQFCNFKLIYKFKNWSYLKMIENWSQIKNVGFPFLKILLLGLKLIWRQPVNLGFNSQNALVFWALSTQNAWWWKGKIFQLDGGLGYTRTRFKFLHSSQTFGMLTTRVLRNQSMNERIVNEALVCQFKSHFLTQSQLQVGNFTHGYMKKLSVRNGTQFKFHFPDGTDFEYFWIALQKYFLATFIF